MSRELGVQFARQGVRVNALCPGPVETPLLLRLFDETPGAYERRRVHLPMGRLAKPREIVNARALPRERRVVVRERRDVPRRRRAHRRLRHARVARHRVARVGRWRTASRWSGSSASSRTSARVDGIDLVVAEGEIYGFLGPNGAGKSTTVHMLDDAAAAH